MKTQSLVSARFALVLVLGVSLPFVLWQISHVLLLGFAGGLFGLFLVKLSHLLRKLIPLPYPLSLAIICLGLLSCGVLLALSLAPGAIGQAELFRAELPKALEQVQAFVSTYKDVLPPLTEGASNMFQNATKLLGLAGNAVTLAFDALTGFAVIVLVGIFVALQPSMYTKNLVQVFPKEMRSNVRTIISTLSKVLWNWLLARLVSMTVVGILTTIGLLIIGMPLAPGLGALAGLLSFIPNFGPLLSLAPALLLGIGQDPSYLYLIPIVYVSVQVIESNFITPFVEQYAVAMPAGIVILAQAASVILFGVLGLLMATPITLATFVILQTLYDDKNVLPES